MRTSLKELSGCWRRVAVALALLTCVALAACQPSVNVSTAANVPAQYSHVWVTLQKVAFTTSATAGPTDSSWKQFTLPSPQTIDLTTVTNGALSQIASSLSLPTGTYNQMQLVLVDSNATLTSSAQSAGALYNDEVDTTNSSGDAERLPLQVPNAAQGITFAISLTVQSEQQAALAAFACGQSSSSDEGLDTGTSTTSTCQYGTETASDCTAGEIYDSLIGSCIQIGNATDTLTGLTSTTSSSTSCAYGTTYDSSTGACISTGTSVSEECSYDQVYDPTTGACTSSLGSASTAYEVISFDASRDLVPYSLSGQSGFLLIPHVAGYDLAESGTIEGQVDVGGLPSGVGPVEVTAETSNGTQNVIVASAPLESSGDFVLYPLPCTASTSTSSSSSSSSSSSAGTSCGTATQDYDLVIHGPGIATVIVQDVPVTAGSPSSSTALSLGVTLTAATSYTVSLSSAVSPPSAWIGFYQTIPSSSTTTSVPYLIEARPVDPFTGTFDTAQSLSEGSPEYGVYSSGATTLTSFVPQEGAMTYSVGASAPLYGNGPLSTTVAPPSSGSGPATFTATAIPLPSGTTAETVSGTVTVASPGKYNEGELLLTQDGALVAVTPLNSYLSGSSSGNVTLFSSVPGGTSTSVYYAEVWVWNSSDPSGSLSRQPQSTPIDLTSGSASGVAITIN